VIGLVGDLVEHLMHIKEKLMIEVKGRNGIVARLITDSISQNGKRFSTFELEYPRFIHSEFMTHRMISKNASSSRAVPIGRAIQNILDNPAFPVHWGAAQAGMQASNELIGVPLDVAKELWRNGIEQSISLVKEFDDIGCHKQIAARWLEPGQIIKVVASGTDWDNLMWLRNDDAAQPEFHELAKCVQECFEKSTPELLYPGEYHIPYVTTVRTQDGTRHYIDSNSDSLSLDDALKISASCTAQISYRRLDDTKDKALEIFEKLFSGTKPHMSPTEHQGTPILLSTVPWNPSTWQEGITHVRKDGTLCSGNLTGWIQYRQTLPNNVYVKKG
jgi:hypothetical protein